MKHAKDANGMAGSEDPNQTAPEGAVGSWSSLFVQNCLYLYLSFRGYIEL